MQTFHSSRSRYEAFMQCPRFGYIQYAWGGRGIVKKGKNIFLTTGIWLHKGLEMIGRWLLNNKKTELPEDILEHIIQKCKEGYFEHVFPLEERKRGLIEGFDLDEEGTNEFHEGGAVKRPFTDLEKQRIQQQTFEEQAALVEALLRIFVLRTLPNWLARFRLVAIERDMAFPLLATEEFEIIQSATIDWTLQEIESKDIYIVSFKSAKQYDIRTEKGHAHDFQGLSETWAMDEYFRSKGINKKVEGVLMLFLIKGQRREIKKGSGIYKQHSPLIRGYRKLSSFEIEYAHSMYFPNPKNDSGIGRLGKGWEPFQVFGEDYSIIKEVGGLKGWIEKLSKEEIQPECGDIVGEQLIEPIPYSRKEDDISSWLTQTKFKEKELAENILVVQELKKQRGQAGFKSGLDMFFQQNRRACHYPVDCVYIPICHGTEEERWNPFGNGYEWREPHHKVEMIQIEGVK